LQVGDVSVIHPGTSTFHRTAANTAGATLAHHDKQKRWQYRRQGSMGCLFVPPTLEKYSRSGKPLMPLLANVGQLAADRGQGLFTKQRFGAFASADTTRCSSVVWLASSSKPVALPSSMA
jgi:hypothetical protein